MVDRTQRKSNQMGGGQKMRTTAESRVSASYGDTEEEKVIVIASSHFSIGDKSLDAVADEQGMQNEPKATPKAFKQGGVYSNICTQFSGGNDQLKMQFQRNTEASAGVDPYKPMTVAAESEIYSAGEDSDGQALGGSETGVRKNSRARISGSGAQTKKGQSLNTSSQTTGAKTTSSHHYQLQGIQRSMNRVDKFLRPASVLSNDRKNSTGTAAQPRVSKTNINSRTSSSKQPANGLGKIVHKQQQELMHRQQELEKASSALAQAKQTSASDYKKKLIFQGSSSPEKTMSNQDKAAYTSSNSKSAAHGGATSTASGFKAKVNKSLSFSSNSAAQQHPAQKSATSITQKPKVMSASKSNLSKQFSGGSAQKGLTPAKKWSAQNREMLSQTEEKSYTNINDDNPTVTMDNDHLGTTSQHNASFEPIDIDLKVRQQSSVHGGTEKKTNVQDDDIDTTSNMVVQKLEFDDESGIVDLDLKNDKQYHHSTNNQHQQAVNHNIISAQISEDSKPKYVPPTSLHSVQSNDLLRKSISDIGYTQKTELQQHKQSNTTKKTTKVATSSASCYGISEKGGGGTKTKAAPGGGIKSNSSSQSRGGMSTKSRTNNQTEITSPVRNRTNKSSVYTNKNVTTRQSHQTAASTKSQHHQRPQSSEAAAKGSSTNNQTSNITTNSRHNKYGIRNDPLRQSANAVQNTKSVSIMQQSSKNSMLSQSRVQTATAAKQRAQQASRNPAVGYESTQKSSVARTNAKIGGKTPQVQTRQNATSTKGTISVQEMTSDVELERLQNLTSNFDFEIFSSHSLLQQQSSTVEEGQVGGSSKVQNDEDMSQYNVFQRFCVLLLTIHGQVDKFKSSSKTEGQDDMMPDTTQFLKSLNVYKAIVEIDSSIREQKFTPNQLSILIRHEQNSTTPLPRLQIFINTAVDYALSLRPLVTDRNTMPTHQKLQESLKTVKPDESRNKLSYQSKTTIQISNQDAANSIEQPSLGIQKMETYQDTRTNMVQVSQSIQPRDKKSLSFCTSKMKSINGVGIDDKADQQKNKNLQNSRFKQSPQTKKSAQKVGTTTQGIRNVSSSPKNNNFNATTTSHNQSQKELLPRTRNRVKSTLTSSKTQANLTKVSSIKKQDMIMTQSTIQVQSNNSSAVKQQNLNASSASQSNLNASSMQRAKLKFDKMLTNQNNHLQSAARQRPHDHLLKSPNSHTQASTHSNIKKQTSATISRQNKSPIMRPTTAARKQKNLTTIGGGQNEDLSIGLSQSRTMNNSVSKLDTIKAPSLNVSESKNGLYEAMTSMKAAKKGKKTVKAGTKKIAPQALPYQQKSHHTEVTPQMSNSALTSARTIFDDQQNQTNAQENSSTLQESPSSRPVKIYSANSSRRRSNQKSSHAPKTIVQYAPMSLEQSNQLVNNALQFLDPQCLDDSDFVENEYIFDMCRLPKTIGEADLMAKHFEDDARRWLEYDEYDEEDNQYEVMNADLFQQQHQTTEQGTSHSFMQRDNNTMGDSIGQSVARFGSIEKQKSDIMNKSPSELAEQAVLQGSNVNLAMIQKIKSMGSNGLTQNENSVKLPATMNKAHSSLTNDSRAFDKTGANSNTLGDMSRSAANNQYQQQDAEEDMFDRDEISQI